MIGGATMLSITTFSTIIKTAVPGSVLQRDLDELGGDGPAPEFRQNSDEEEA
jgi:hypothetical protein